MRGVYRGYLVRQSLAIGAALASIAAFNLVVDPYDAYRIALASALAGYKNTGTTRRTKAEMVRHGDWEVVLLGSSRVEIGLDPSHPALAGRSALNLGLSGTTLPEIEGALDYALARPSVQSVLLLAEFELFGDGARTGDEFRRSPFDPGYGRVEYHGSNLLGMQATERSVRTLRDYATGRAALHDRLGRMIFPLNGFESGHLALFERALGAGAPERGFRYEPTQLERFERMIDACLARGVDLAVATAPSHALALEAYARRGLFGAWQEWKRDLTAAVDRRNRAHFDRPPARLYDFGGFSSYNCEPVPRDPSAAMRWYWEPTHFKKELGDALLARIYGKAGPEGDFGVGLEPASIDAHLARQRADRVRYAAARAEDLRLLDDRG